MIIILAIDALEYKKVEEFNCKNLKQEYYGKTDIKEFSQPRTMVLWSSFMTGQNKESEVMAEGNKEMWNKMFQKEETLFSKFSNQTIIDLPGYSYDLKAHENSRKLLKKFFEEEDKGKKEQIKKEYNKDAVEHHQKIKKQFEAALNQEHDLVLGYFSVIDVIGHLNFGDHELMKMLYQEFDEMVGIIKHIHDLKLIIISDHGMKSLGRFGDHSEYGFWSTNFKELGTPKITDFKKIIENI